MFTDSTGHAWWNPFSWSNITKIIVGVAIIAVLGVATILTGGAAGGVVGFILSGAFQGALAGALTGAVGGALVGGIIGGITTGSWEGAINGAIDGAATGFMTGSVFGGIGGAVGRLTTLSKWDPGTFGSKYDSMMYHFESHGIQSGSNFWGNNMVNYTYDAFRFGQQNVASATWKTYLRPDKQPGWLINNSFGKGLYTDAWEIIYFLYK